MPSVSPSGDLSSALTSSYPLVYNGESTSDFLFADPTTSAPRHGTMVSGLSSISDFGAADGLDGSYRPEPRSVDHLLSIGNGSALESAKGGNKLQSQQVDTPSSIRSATRLFSGDETLRRSNRTNSDYSTATSVESDIRSPIAQSSTSKLTQLFQNGQDSFTTSTDSFASSPSPVANGMDLSAALTLLQMYPAQASSASPRESPTLLTRGTKPPLPRAVSAVAGHVSLSGRPPLSKSATSRSRVHSRTSSLSASPLAMSYPEDHHLSSSPQASPSSSPRASVFSSPSSRRSPRASSSLHDPDRTPIRSVSEDSEPSAGSSAVLPRSTSTSDIRPLSFHSNRSSTDLKGLIQQKRRQASAPFYNTLSHVQPHFPAESDPQASTSSESGSFTPWEPRPPPPRRARSRHATRQGHEGLTMSMPDLTVADASSGKAFDEARLKALGGIGEVVVTPTTEEWRMLGLDSQVMAAERGTPPSEEEIEDLDNDRLKSEPMQQRSSSIEAFNSFHGYFPPSRSSFDSQTTGSSSSVRSQSRLRRTSDGSEQNDMRKEDDEEARDVESHQSQRNDVMPALSRQSLSRTTGLPGAGASNLSDNLSPTEIICSPNVSRVSSPVPLGHTGPIDPRSYSAVTGARSIANFLIEGDAGKGAYGLVRKARESGVGGQAVGPDLMLKYIVKQRILADAWKRHKVLGPIPVEIHVLDHIRRVYRPQPEHHGRFLPASSLAATLTVGHPNLCGMLDFFEDAENYYLVMPCFGKGQDLFDYVDLAPEGLSIQEARSILGQIVDGLEFLHSHGIVHRDIKDENVILDGKGGVQLIDFGSAAYIKEGKPFFDTFSGTLDFASPEVLRGERYGGKETDIWALGVLGYVILRGECPFWTSEEAMVGLLPNSRAAEALLAKCLESSASDNVKIELDNSDSASATGGASAEEAVDLVTRCLEVNARDRPSAGQILKHRFLLGEQGWIGFRGWEALEGNQDKIMSE